jgi:hypothetical protein
VCAVRRKEGKKFALLMDGDVAQKAKEQEAGLSPGWVLICVNVVCDTKGKAAKVGEKKWQGDAPREREKGKWGSPS